MQAAGAGGKPELLERRLGIEDDLAAIRKAEFEKAARPIGIDVDHVLLKPSVDRRFHARQHSRSASVIVSVGQALFCGCHERAR